MDKKFPSNLLQSNIKPRVSKTFFFNYLIEKVMEKKILLSNKYVKGHKLSSLEFKMTSSKPRLGEIPQLKDLNKTTYFYFYLFILE